MRVTLGKASLGREQITLGVRICCWVYVYSSEADDHKQTGPDTSKKIENKKRTRPYVVDRT